MNKLTLRKQIINTVRKFNTSGLSLGTSGNLSARTERGMLITPTGVPYTELKSADLVELDLKGNPLAGKLIPSSEWRIHSDIYTHRPEINAVVHMHSSYATAVSSTRQSIPAIHYHIALIGGDTVRCANYATFGTAQLSRNAMKALDGRLACLLANHGQLAIGTSIPAAMKIALEVEQLAKLFCIAKLAGKPVLLDEAEVGVNIDKFRHYGQRRK